MYKNYKSWYLIDAQDKTLGRLSTHVAKILQGKNMTTYLPYIDTGSYIIIINAAKIKVTGHKSLQKVYYRTSDRPGHLKKEIFFQLKKRLPQRIIETSVKGMLPKNSLGRELFTKLKVYETSEHPHVAQKPKLLKIK